MFSLCISSDYAHLSSVILSTVPQHSTADLHMLYIQYMYRHDLACEFAPFVFKITFIQFTQIF